jgi:type IV pilus assembly protein PilC
MARYKYTAEKTGGEIYRGVAEATDRFELYQMIRREGGKVLTVEPERAATSLFSFSYWNSKIATVPAQAKILFARNLSAMLKAGLPLTRALAVIERQTKNAKFTGILAEISTAVRTGSTLHEALAQHPKTFNSLFVAMVKSGEESGDLSGSLGMIAEQMDRTHTLKKKIKGALIYPAIIVIAIIGIGILMLTQVVPTLAATFKEMNAELPTATRAIIGVSDFLLNNTLIALVAFVLIAVGFIMALRTEKGKRVKDLVFYKMPVIGGIVREVNAARAARTLSSLLTSGVDVLTAISITGEVVQNTYFRAVLVQAHDDVEHGKPLSKSFAVREDLYPPLVGEMIAVGEETGQLGEMLKRLADFYEEEVTRKTKDMSTIIEPFLMVLIGGAVGFFAYAMIGPIYQLSETI